jgi:hypothetical protein
MKGKKKHSIFLRFIPSPLGFLFVDILNPNTDFRGCCLTAQERHVVQKRLGTTHIVITFRMYAKRISIQYILEILGIHSFAAHHSTAIAVART